ncbi:autotransporter outer membrane beta-barrel domain-containing protein [Yersinia hibernica]|uniref:autotransporter outer membrane beta-barrel domain-containing protein n=1 Tax=Yersinia hibernica TaxID=2339259 RepID=UPI001FE6FB50|nr:autotransporter outer membrane beta-barrel domain-containing protein [Yersinia hibernica]
MLDDLDKVNTTKKQLHGLLFTEELQQSEEARQELRTLEEQGEYLNRQLSQHQYNLQQAEQQFLQYNPHLGDVLDLDDLDEEKRVIKQRQQQKSYDLKQTSRQQQTDSTAENTPAVGPVAEPKAKPAVQTKVASKSPSRSKKKALAPAPKPAIIISHNPQAGNYLANQAAAQQMFMADDLHHRQREIRYIDPITGEQKVSSMWLNTSAAKSRFNSGNSQLQTKSHRYAIQLGGTLSQWSSGAGDLGTLGITTGLGKSTNRSHSSATQHQAQGSVDGYNLGLYHIWYADNQTRLGPYIDLLTQYGWFNNQVKAHHVISGANYKSYVFTGALETGYKVQLVETADSRLLIQPKAKVSWQRMSGMQYKEATGTQIMIEESQAVATKLGIRTALELDIATLSSTKTLQLSPSFEANWIHNSDNKGIWFGTTNIKPQGNSNIADLKLGIEANIDSHLRLWTHLGHQLGGSRYSDTQATLGANYRF